MGGEGERGGRGEDGGREGREDSLHVSPRDIITHTFWSHVVLLSLNCLISYGGGTIHVRRDNMEGQYGGTIWRDNMETCSYHADQRTNACAVFIATIYMTGWHLNGKLLLYLTVLVPRPNIHWNNNNQRLQCWLPQSIHIYVHVFTKHPTKYYLQ